MRLLTTTAIVLTLASTVLADVDGGIELYNQGKYGQAETELRKAVEKDSADAQAHRYLGLALIEQNKVDEAAGHITKADEISSSGDTKVALARLYIAQKDYDKAEAALGEASGDNVDYVRGLLHFQRKQYDDAAKDFEAQLKKKPGHAYAHYYAGMAYNNIKRPDKMMTHFELFLKARPDAPEARKVRAVLQTGR
jgi:tetratricopeptide (TPR) repeat protein